MGGTQGTIYGGREVIKLPIVQKIGRLDKCGSIVLKLLLF